MKPRAAIRRFDVFAEYNRQKAIAAGTPPAEAAGHGLWVAKVVASRGFGRSLQSQSAMKLHEQEAADPAAPRRATAPEWHTLNGEAQTDALFEAEVVDRMGREFYESVFLPAIETAVREDRTYQSIRDTIRRDWKP